MNPWKRIQDRLGQRFPRTAGFYARHRNIISPLLVVAVVGGIAFLGIELHATESEVTKVRGDVNIIKQKSACAPTKDGIPREPDQCQANFDTIIKKVLTPLQACEILERGASVTEVGGRPLGLVKCHEPSTTVTGGRLRSNPGVSTTPRSAHDARQGSQIHEDTGTTAPERTVAPTESSSASEFPRTHPRHPGRDTSPTRESPTAADPAQAPMPITQSPSPDTSSGTATGSQSSAATNPPPESTIPVTPPVEESTTPVSPASPPRLLPEVIEPVEHVTCGLLGTVVCSETRTE